MAEGLVFALYLALLMSMVVAFFWMAFNIAPIRRMLEALRPGAHPGRRALESSS